jgi:hypothetical protein
MNSVCNTAAKSRVRMHAMMLALAITTGCYRSSPPDGADTSTSWLHSCQSQSDCADGYACVDGRCEARPTQESAGQFYNSDTGRVPAPSSMLANAGQSSGSAGASPVQRGETLLLSVPERQAGPLTVRWVGDHWAVAWLSLSYPKVDPGPSDQTHWFEIVNVSTQGDVGDRVLNETAWHWSEQLELSESGRLGVIDIDPWSSPSCTFRWLDPDDSVASAGFDIPCGEDQLTAFAPVPGSEDWLIAYGTGNPDTVGNGDYSLGLFRPSLGDWQVQPIVLQGRAGPAALGAFVSGRDALVVYGDAHESAIMSVDDFVSATRSPDDTVEVSLQSLPASVLGSDADFELAQQGDHALVFGVDRTSLWVAPRAGYSDSVEVHHLAPTRVQDRRPSAAFAARSGLTGVCYATGSGPSGGSGDHRDGVSFLLVDQQGEAVGDPVVLATGLQAIGGCGVASSGDAFLVAWWDNEDLDPEPLSLVRAEILKVR